MPAGYLATADNVAVAVGFDLEEGDNLAEVLNAVLDELRLILPVLQAVTDYDDATTSAGRLAAINALEAALAGIEDLERINPDYIDDDYMLRFDGQDLYVGEGVSVADIQDEIDWVNEDEAETALADNFSALDADLRQAAVDALDWVDDDPAVELSVALAGDWDGYNEANEDKEYWLEQLDEYEAVIAVADAETEGALEAAFAMLDDQQTGSDFDIETVLADYMEDYLTAIEAAADGDKNTPTKIDGLVTGVNTDNEDDALEAVNNATDSDTDGVGTPHVDYLDPDDEDDRATFLELLLDLAYVSGDLDADTIDARIVKEYMEELDWDSDSGTPHTAAEIQAAITAENAAIVGTRLGVLEAAAADGDTTAGELLEALEDEFLELENVLPANADVYLADRAGIEAAAGGTVATVQTLVNHLNEVATVNAAENATQMRAALVAFVDTDQLLTTPASGISDDYLGLSAAVRLEIAQMVLDERPEVDGFANRAAVITVVEAEIAAHATSVSLLNQSHKTLILPAFTGLEVYILNYIALNCLLTGT